MLNIFFNIILGCLGVIAIASTLFILIVIIDVMIKQVDVMIKQVKENKFNNF